MIKVSNLNKFYNKGKSNEIHVINNVSLMLPDTGLVTFLGKSGSGKTTLLNVIGGLDRATGVICYDDVKFKNYSMNKVDEFRREYIGYVFQNYNLLKTKSVWENLEIALEVINITDKEEVKKRIEYSLKAVGLYKFRKKQVFALSGGQMQRVSIARALVKNSKIIIADEPTGNLDSENSVEIMNILKKISKKSLVLLVTHERPLAEYYSDRIIEICDGKIENIREGLADTSLEDSYLSNTIYLEDLNKVDGDDGKLSYHLLSNKEEDFKLELTIIKRNNQYYIQSNKKIKLLEDTNLKIMDKRPEVNKEKSIEEFNYDTSFYNDKKSKNLFKRFFQNLKSSFKDYFQTRKRTKFFHFAFFLIGVVLASLNISYVSYSKINTDNLVYEKNLYGVENFANIAFNENSYSNYKDFINEAFVSNKIDKFYSSDNDNFYSQLNFSSFDSRSINISCMRLEDDLISDKTILLGKSSTNEHEIVLSKTLADKFLKTLEMPEGDYSILLNKKFRYSYYSDYKIVGIVDGDSVACYYKNISSVSQNSIYGENQSFYLAKSASCNYEISSGRDIQNNLEGIVHINSTCNIGDKVNGITIVGKFKEKGITLKSPVIVEDEDTNNPIYPNNYDLQSLILVNDSTFSYQNFDFYGYRQTYFTINDIEGLKQLASKYGIVVQNSYDIIISNNLKSNKESKFMLIPVMLILLAITLIYIYFSMRSKMINDIYSIGVLRSIGFSRTRIIGKYVCEIFVTTLLTSLFGYLIVSGVYDIVATKFSGIGIGIQTVLDFYSTYVLGLGLMLANILIGLIPIVTLMRKSPSEIIAKYDI